MASRRANGLGPRCRPAGGFSGATMEPYLLASVLRTCRGFVAHRGVACQNSISGLPQLFSRPCCRPLVMPLRKVAVAVMEVAVTAGGGPGGGGAGGGAGGGHLGGGGAFRGPRAAQHGRAAQPQYSCSGRRWCGDGRLVLRSDWKRMVATQ